MTTSKKTADLHIHSYYSDGTMSPAEILAGALKNQVGAIAITDHDMLEGALELKELCKDKDIIFLPGVELDSLEGGENIHILGYGVDLQNEEFADFVQRNRILLHTVNEELIKKMQEVVPSVSMSEYNAFPYDRRKGGWKALQYLMTKGFTTHLKEGIAYYTQYDCPYACVDFPSIEEVCNQIHQAGGKAVLAHPGVSIKETDLSAFQQKLLQIMDYPLDGMECYYVTHSEEITEICLKLCREKNLLITAGSDCHGTFGKVAIGDIGTLLDKINLGDLIK